MIKNLMFTKYDKTKGVHHIYQNIYIFYFTPTHYVIFSFSLNIIHSFE